MSDTTTTPTKAGRELDALVAEKVMGLRWRRFDYPPAGSSFAYGKPWTWLSSSYAGGDPEGDETRYIDNVRHYSSDIAAAWEVVGELVSLGARVNVMNRYAPTWGCNIITDIGTPHERQHFHGSCESAPLAICLAALAAVSEVPL